MKFYSIKNISNSLVVINNLQRSYNAKKRKLNEIDNIPAKSKICKTCYELIKHVSTNIDPNESELPIYRKELSFHN